MIEPGSSGVHHTLSVGNKKARESGPFLLQPGTLEYSTLGETLTGGRPVFNRFEGSVVTQGDELAASHFFSNSAYNILSASICFV